MRLFAKLVLPPLISLLLILVMLQFYWAPLQLKNAKSDFLISNKNEVSAATPMLVRDLLLEDLTGLYEHLDTLKNAHKEDWRNVQLFDETGKRLYPLFEQPVEPGPGQEFIPHTHPLSISGSELGHVQIDLNWSVRRDALLGELADFRNLIAALIVLVIVITIVNFQGSIIRPLRQFEQAISSISMGNMEVVLPDVAPNEFGDLARSFEKMVSELAERTAMLEHAIEQMDLMLLISPVGFLLLDGDGICSMHNRSLVDLLKTDPDLEGRSLAEIDAMIRDGMIVVSDAPLESEGGLILRQPDSEVVVKLSLFAREQASDGRTASLLAAIDISQEHALSVAKSYFISAASHELRTPLASIVGFSDLMLATPEQLGNDENRRMLDAINRQARVLESVVSQLLDISRIETGQDLQANIVSVDIREAVDTAVSSFRAVEMKHQIECAYDDAIPEVELDVDNFSRVIHNLLSNACKYSADNSRVIVRVLGPVAPATRAIVEVEDHGIGMSKDQVERMFEPFYRVDESRHLRGLGIGMHIVRELVDAMGMEIHVQSELDHGTTVRLEVPLASEPVLG